MLKDLNPGTANAFNPTAGFDPHFTLFNNKMFFVANDGITGYELWSTDGTAAGTSLFKDIRLPAQENNISGSPDGFGAFWTGFSTNYYSKTPFKVVNNKMYFVSNRMINYGVAGTGDQFILYEIDGTTAGTNYVVLPVPPGNIMANDFLSNTTSSYIGLTESNNELYISNARVSYTSTPAFQVGLYKISSTNVFSRIANFYIPNIGAKGTSVDAQLGEMYKMNDEFYFLGINPNLSPTSSDLHLYKLNPASETFTQLTTTTGGLSNYDNYLLARVVDNQLYFYKDVPDEIFVTNGTTAGTSQLARTTLNNTTILSNQNITSDVLGMSDFNNSLYFNAGISFGQNSLYRIFNSPLSVVENEKSTFKIYPNPTSNGLNLQFPNLLENGYVKIISITGQTVLELKNVNGTNFAFDVSNLNAGLYLLQVSDATNQFTSKFIKQ
jgi:ELWxxDGT repeat protein